MRRLRASLKFFGSGIPSIPTGMPTWMLIPPLGILGALGVLLTFNVRSPLQMLVGAAIFSTFALVASHRSWALVPLLLADHSIGSYRIESLGMSFRLAVTVIGCALAGSVVYHHRHAVLGDPAARRVLGPAFAFVVVSTVVNLLFSELDFVMKELRYQIMMLATIVLVIVLLRERRSLSIVSTVVFTIAVISALVAVGQRLGDPLAWYVTPSGLPDLQSPSRVPGLTPHPVGLQHNLISVAMPALGFLAACWSPRLRRRWVLLLGVVIMLVGVVLTTTRSAILAFPAGAVMILLLVEGNRRLPLGTMMVIGGLLVGVAVAAGLADERFSAGAADDRSAAGHLSLAQVGIAVTLDNVWLGIGHEHFPDVSRGYVSEVNVAGGSRAQQSGAEVVGDDRPHNDFLDVWSSWGILGIISYLGIFVGSFINFMAARRSSIPLVRGLAIGCIAGLIAYAVTSSFHNVLTGSLILCFYAGLSAALPGIGDRAPYRLAALRSGPIQMKRAQLRRAALAVRREPARNLR